MKLSIHPEAFATSPTHQQKSRQWGRQLVGTVVMIVSMALLMPLVLKAPRPIFSVSSTAVLILSTFLFFPLALFLAVIWHEIGHLLAGRLVGFRFVLVTFGPFRLAREAIGFRFSLINTNLMQWQGRALSIPPDFGDYRRQRMVLLAGGPLATMAHLCLLLALNYGLRDQVVPPWAGLGLLWLLLTAVMLLPATAVPQKIGSSYTDVARIWQLWRGGEKLAQQLALTNLIEASIRGVEPADLDESFIARTLAAPTASDEALVGHYIAHIQAVERGKIAEAAVLLEQTLERLLLRPPAQRSPVILVVAAYFVARYSQDLPEALAWLELIQPEKYNALALEVAQILLRARAQILCQSGELALAKTAALHSLRLLAHSVDLGSVALEKRLLTAMLAELTGVDAAPQLPTAWQPALTRKQAFLAASARGVVRLTIIIALGLLLGFGWRKLLPNRAVDAYQQGIVHLENREYDAAIPDFDRAVALDNQFTQAYWARGEAEMSLGQYETAVADFSRVIELHATTFPSIYLFRAAAYTQLGDYAAAIADYELLISLSPDEELRQLARESIHILQAAQ